MVRAARLVLGALAGLVLAGGCTLQAQVQEAEYYQLLAMLPGEYTNITQAQGDEQRNIHPPHDALVLTVIPIDAPVIAKHAFYVQESAADDPRRIMVQRVWTVDLTDKSIVQKVWTIKEPLRWRDPHPDLLTGMMEQDLRLNPGCEITWKKDGMRFVGTNDGKRCLSTSRATNGTVQVETRIELDATQLALAETGKDAAGQLVQGRTDDPFYKFHRQAP